MSESKYVTNGRDTGLMKAQGDSPIRRSVASVSPYRQRIAVNEIQDKIISLIKTPRLFVLFCDLVALFLKVNFVDDAVVLQDLKDGHGWICRSV